MSTNHTTNYDLNQWEGTDKVLRTEFNEDNAKIDAALKANADAIAANMAAMALKGNCKLEYFTYTGTGKSGANNPTVYTFSKAPVLFLACGEECVLLGSKYLSCLTAYTFKYDQVVGARHMTWAGNQLSFYSSANTQGSITSYNNPALQMNLKNKVYVVAALIPADEDNTEEGT